MSYTVSRNPDYIISTYNTSPDLIAVDPLTKWIVQVISNKGTAQYLYKKSTPMYLRTDPSSPYYLKSDMVTWIDTGASLSYSGGTWSNVIGIEFTPLTPDSQAAVDFIHQYYPATYTQWQKQGIILPTQTVVSNVPVTPAQPLGSVLGDTQYYGDTTGLTPVSGSLLSQGQALQSSDVIQSATTGAPSYEAPPVEQDFQALKDAQASAPTGQTVTNVGIAYTATTPQGAITNETTTATPTPQPVVQTPIVSQPISLDSAAAPAPTDASTGNSTTLTIVVIVIGVAALAFFGFKDARKKIIATVKKGVKA